MKDYLPESHGIFYRLWKAFWRFWGYYKHDEVSFGWQKEPVDRRDYSPEHPDILPILEKLRKNSGNQGPASSHDLSDKFPLSYDQGATGSCTAHASAGALRYLIKSLFQKDFSPSRLFIYKTMRNLLYGGDDGRHADKGGFNRLCMKALVAYGCPPENHWKFNMTNLNEEPRAFHYAGSQNYQLLKYYRLDEDKISRAEVLKRCKEQISLGIPVVLGFRVFESIIQARLSGNVPYPALFERLRGGHAILAVGYDDAYQIENISTGDITIGALKFYNSWGPSWGDGGFGYLPYDYILKKQAWDFWCMIFTEYLDLSDFKVKPKATP